MSCRLAAVPHDLARNRFRRFATLRGSVEDNDWTEANLVAMTTPDLVEFDWTPVDVILDGPSSGRTIESTTGVRMRVAFSADMALFERRSSMF